MITEGQAEQALLQLRIDELERRLARLEEQIRQARPPESQAPHADPQDANEMPFGRRRTDPVIEASSAADPDAGREGARLVALEMLSAGYRSEQVATYLRETFGVDDADTVLADAGPLPG